jgi:hypothetical protein
VKPEKQIVGKTIKAVSNNTQYGTCEILFTDGTRARFNGYTTGSHNDRWTAISITYRDEAANANA